MTNSINQEKAGTSGTNDRMILYLLNFLNKIKCGKLVQQTSSGWIVDFNILENKNSNISRMGSFEFTTFPYLHERKEYKVGRKVIVFFFDDFEEMFINSNQTKEINSAYKHSLANGIIMDVLDDGSENSYIDFNKGLSLFSALGASIILKDAITLNSKENKATIELNEKIKIKNQQADILSTFEKSFDTILNQTQIIPTTLGSPCSIANAPAVKQTIMAEVQKLFEN